MSLSISTNIYTSNCWSSCLNFLKNNSIICTNTQIRIDRIPQVSSTNQIMQRNAQVQHIALAKIITNQTENNDRLPHATIISDGHPTIEAHGLLQVIPKKHKSYEKY